MGGLLLVAGLLLGGVTLNETQIDNLKKEKEFESLNYIVEHMADYNEVRMDEGYKPTNIDYIKSVPINTANGEQIEGRLLKFDEGYLLFGEDEVIHKLSYTNDANINKDALSEFYDIGGFVEYNELTNEFESVYENQIYDGNSIQSTADSSDEPYDGQVNPGEGSIINPDDYILSRYGDGYSLESYYQIRCPVERTARALDASCVELGQYRTNLGVNYFIDEDIYGLVTANIVCDFVEKTYELRFGRNLSYYYDCEKNEPTIYEYKTTHGWWCTERPLSKLNILLRQHMYSEYGTYEWLTKEQVRDTVQWFAEQYNYPLSFSYTNSWKSMYLMTDIFTTTMNKDQIMIVDISNSTTYGELVGSAVGYRHYEKITEILGVKVINQAYLLEFRDTFLYANNFLDISWPGIKAKTITMVTSPGEYNA